MAFMTTVEPSRIVRTRIRETRQRDQRKASTATSSSVRPRATWMQAVTKGAKRSVGMPKPTCRRPSAEISETRRLGLR